MPNETYPATNAERRELIALLYEARCAEWAKAETRSLVAQLRAQHSR